MFWFCVLKEAIYKQFSKGRLLFSKAECFFFVVHPYNNISYLFKRSSSLVQTIFFKKIANRKL